MVHCGNQYWPTSKMELDKLFSFFHRIEYNLHHQSSCIADILTSHGWREKRRPEKHLWQDERHSASWKAWKLDTFFEIWRQSLTPTIWFRGHWQCLAPLGVVKPRSYRALPVRSEDQPGVLKTTNYWAVRLWQVTRTKCDVSVYLNRLEAKLQLRCSSLVLTRYNAFCLHSKYILTQYSLKQV